MLKAHSLSKLLRWGVECCLCLWAGYTVALTMLPPEAAPAAPSLQHYQAPSKAYSVAIPKGWGQNWSAATDSQMPSTLQLLAPRTAGPEYVSFSILHYASEQKTPQRYLFDLVNQGAGRQVSRQQGDKMVAGVLAKTLEITKSRYSLLGMGGDAVPSVIRHVVIPARKGFFVLRYDAPRHAVDDYHHLFDRMVESFRPAAQTNNAMVSEQISADEYAVYTAFFKLKPQGGPEMPQFFYSVPKSRRVDGHTMVPKSPLNPSGLEKIFGKMPSGLIADYQHKNQQPWLLSDKILVPYLQVMPPEEPGTYSSASTREDELNRIDRGIATLSRVGFSPAGDIALFSVSLYEPRAMLTRYLVLMHKKDGGWDFSKAAMESFIHH